VTGLIPRDTRIPAGFADEQTLQQARAAGVERAEPGPASDRTKWLSERGGVKSAACTTAVGTGGVSAMSSTLILGMGILEASTLGAALKPISRRHTDLP